ncbi:MAG: drug/metabolite transporter (DMT)-like permease [Gammaproteobacteria bacterium]|jgi:drug/metabolite transporter (DMT)-like permease
MLLVSRPAITEGDDVRAGILWMLLTTLFFVSLDATAKFLVARYPVMEVVWARFIFHMLFVIIVLAPRLREHASARRPWLQIGRSALILMTTVLFFFGVKLLPLADASAIMFISPILLTVLAIPLLGEQVGPRRWAAVIVGFVGALIVVRPGMGVMGTGASLLLAAALCNALYQLATRKLRTMDAPLTTLLYTGSLGAVALSFVMPMVWVTPELAHWPLFALMGAFGAAGHFALIKAFQRAPAAVVAPFSYVNLIWAIGFGFVLFGELPDPWTVLGASLIAGGGLYILHRERVKRVGSQDPAVNTPPQVK